jgi:uncharacterized RDD family membrane protein YckC
MVLHEVITTEKVPFTYRVAGIGSRFLAWLIDLGAVVLLLVAGLFMGSVVDIGREGTGLAVLAVWSFVVQWGYFLLFEWLWHGQTPGKRVLGIRVISTTGTGLSFTQAVVRNVLRVADGLPLLVVDIIPLTYGLGFVVAACNRYHRRLGDLAAGTLVVHMERKGRAVQALADAPHEMDRAQEMQLRQRLGQLDRQQKQALLDLCLRRDQLSVRDRAQMFQTAAEHLRQRWKMPPQEHQSDEKFIQQLAALLGERQPEAQPVPTRVLRHRHRQAQKG